MGKSKANPKIATTAILKEISVKPDQDSISLLEMDLNDTAIVTVSNWIKDKMAVNVTIKPVAGNPNFPPICAEATMKHCDINQGSQTPKFIGLQFSSDQIAQLTGYVRGRDPVAIEIEIAPAKEGPLFEGDKDEDNEVGGKPDIED